VLGSSYGKIPSNSNPLFFKVLIDEVVRVRDRVRVRVRDKVKVRAKVVKGHLSIS
jgi:hypothetical protein